MANGALLLCVLMSGVWGHLWIKVKMHYINRGEPAVIALALSGLY